MADGNSVDDGNTGGGPGDTMNGEEEELGKSALNAKQPKNGTAMDKPDKENKTSFDIFSYLHRVYAKYGLYEEDMDRFLLYVKRRRAKLKGSILYKMKKVGNKYITRLYETDNVDGKYLELLLLDVEACRCRYIKIKTDVNNLKVPYRSTYSYLRRVKRALEKVKFMCDSVESAVDKNTELQIKCYGAYIQVAYLLEVKKFEEGISKVEEFTKLVKLVKKAMLNEIVEGSRSFGEGKNDDGEEGVYKESQGAESREQRRHSRVNQHIQNDLTENTLMNSKGNLLIEAERKIEETFDYFLSVIHSFERICLYNLKKNKLSTFDEKLQDEELQFPGGKKKSSIREITEVNKDISTYRKLEILMTENKVQINIEHSTYELKGNGESNQGEYASLLKIKNVLDNVKNVIPMEEIKNLYEDMNLREFFVSCVNKEDFPLFKFLNSYQANFIVQNYSQAFAKYYECLTIIHEQLIKSTGGDKKASISSSEQGGRGKVFNEESKMMEKIWNHMEEYLSCEKLYTDTERTLLVLMKFLFSIYSASHLKNFSLGNKKNFGDIIEEMPMLHTGIRYADILKQNIDELSKLKNNDDIFINILQIIKNVKSFCLACHYAMLGKNAEAHVLFDLVKTRNYVYTKFQQINMIHNESLLRITILFNRLQDIISLVNEIYYFRHLSIYALQVKTKCVPSNQKLFFVDSSFFEQKMIQMSMDPLRIDMMQLCRDSFLLNPDTHKEEEKSSGIRGLLRSFWK
ncbi:signal recognition particle subunit SRP68, putative [Plasmodium knowlesi strain H]|uniref:Signal recognition particle subunit SRP68 n=3 Tax=Plasmodium knowlesi TaxID=5850 RepID=A0A5K1VEN5_PLAKH|nr:signal recognition particle subunit SRP68, putative [Plasmodium knowlesi strain H]OTN64656.1 putative Signal recognition particle subunit SRP68 [Plasmodium knowlesi]CAA9989111.1 signal recognition particle subunit SRP68, putative [Plasmodium knowlesi strain H]SBO27326.1 signal recognition particle subunit SRP68, putative [Plasmodium knowlesi strain H]SBO28950.1 signal recognition particle subunit SRP68, putative [Plasmodium knowlesi strain H]VVS78585.1 signal recognition particle subunit SR|eukprot:XP_002261458.1 hypothetical protein, conserved in Plasmodium species [Plasmodium knowlesi strain H]